ncbi:MAG: bifunctional 4-hydroxy-2-oxoglutarate aldolase/2-dehydro-3-deoxy-phosphogluconate aldolase [Clostridiales bacterium]|nr:bifunctional 4-hydroxy-2-oxoglutarate aldolase/2-dehydro-3-deoxy-phosphogluconate aldolase [Clostridiales bacterium]
MKDLIKTIEEEKIIVIVRGVDSNKLIPLAEAMYKGGIKLLEVTYSANGKVSDEETAQNIKALADHFKGKMYIGAGTVLTEKQVELTKQAGGTFIISPDAYENVIKKTKELGLVSMPGAITPTEIQNAHRCGADFIKLFPMSNFGVSYFKAIKAPLSHIKFMAVGGVDENNMSEYLNAGISGFGIGSNIVKKDMIDNCDYENITKLAEKYVSIIKN